MKKLLLLLAILTLSFQNYAQGSKLTSADSYRQLGQLDRALEAVEEAVGHEKTMADPRTYYIRGQVYRAIGFDTAEFKNLAPDPLFTAYESFEKSVELDDEKQKYVKRVMKELPFVQYGLFNVGAAAYSAGDYELAFKNFEGAMKSNKLMVKIEPATELDTSTMFNVALTAQKSGRLDLARTMYNELVEMGYSEIGLYQSLVSLYINEGDNEGALGALEKAREKFPNDQALLISELNIYLGMGRAADALDKFEIAIKNDPENPELYMALGTAYNEMARLDSLQKDKYYEEAINAYKNAIKYKPESWEPNLNIGALYYNQAILINKELVNVDLDDEATYNTLTAKRNELYKKALPYLESATSINPETIQGWEALKEIYAKTGQMDKSNNAKVNIDRLKGN